MKVNMKRSRSMADVFIFIEKKEEQTGNNQRDCMLSLGGEKPIIYDFKVKRCECIKFKVSEATVF